MNVLRNVKRKRIKKKENENLIFDLILFLVYCFEVLFLRRLFKDGFIFVCSGNCK